MEELIESIELGSWTKIKVTDLPLELRGPALDKDRPPDHRMRIPIFRARVLKRERRYQCDEGAAPLIILKLKATGPGARAGLHSQGDRCPTPRQPSGAPATD